MLRVVGCALLLTMYLLFLAVYALLLSHHARGASLTPMLITGVVGTVSMLAVAVPESFTWIIGILTATSPATFTLRALRHREAPAAQLPRRP
jgi:hypothetical protein